MKNTLKINVAYFIIIVSFFNFPKVYSTGLNFENCPKKLKVKVQNGGLNVRSGPSTKFFLVAEPLKSGTIIDCVCSIKNDWHIVKLPNNTVGVVSAKYTEEYEENVQQNVSTDNVVAENNSYYEQKFDPGDKENKNEDKKAYKVSLQIESEFNFEEEELLSLINANRLQYGLPSYTLNKKLSEVARIKAKDAADFGYEGHDSPIYKDPYSMMTYFKINYNSAAGENIVEANDVNIGHDLLMNSSSNRSNILSEQFSEIGIGIVSKPDKTLKIVEMFIRA